MCVYKYTQCIYITYIIYILYMNKRDPNLFFLEVLYFNSSNYFNSLLNFVCISLKIESWTLWTFHNRKITNDTIL